MNPPVLPLRIAKTLAEAGVLAIDCTPIWDGLDISDIRTDVCVYDIPRHLGGPRSGSVPCIRYDEATFSTGLRQLEDAIRGSPIRTLILWKHEAGIQVNHFKREVCYRVLDGAVFWSYFGKVLAFPGPDAFVKYPEH